MDEIGKLAARKGVPRDTAVAAALWLFSKLSIEEKLTIILEYLNYYGDGDV